jgi:hypothetical protein
MMRAHHIGQSNSICIRRPGAFSAVIAAVQRVGLMEPRQALYVRLVVFSRFG